ncbi:MAG TPA: antitoxin Xre-like helix-turn-helix domain-containing protein [Bacteroidales bacterium]|nr:antitoxin Xre-like helix-turn-helix domain-containing protein [Bacteroidales bacterium]
MAKTLSLLPDVSMGNVDDNTILNVIREVRKGIAYNSFTNAVKNVPLTLKEWSGILDLSERTLQRYKKDKRAFDTLQSEKIVQVTLLIRYGRDVFGDENKFNLWLNTENLSIASVKPKELLDSSFGIDLLKDELTRIENGILA